MKDRKNPVTKRGRPVGSKSGIAPIHLQIRLPVETWDTLQALARGTGLTLREVIICLIKFGQMMRGWEDEIPAQK